MPNDTATPQEAPLIKSKEHYPILDGLRGVAALMVVFFHIFEAYASSHLDQRINHGYLAVDFFFILSGFVIGYSYDNRWGKISVMDFIKRRLIRLQPMIVLGAIIGGALFYFQTCPVWDVTQISLLSLLIAVVLNMFLIPATVGTEVRGLGEMFPLNGPSWSLFFEYIGNLLYALVIRRLSTFFLTLLVIASGCGLAAYAIFGSLGDICVGYSLTKMEFLGGSLRLLFSFSAGLLLIRCFKPRKIKGAFWICSALLVTLFAIPRVGGETHLWLNGLYDTLCFALAFPLIVYLGASGKTMHRATEKICNFLGELSYPLYIVHYPFIYMYYGWVKKNALSFTDSLPGAAALVIGCILLAYASLKLYDIPIRKRLSKRFLCAKSARS